MVRHSNERLRRFTPWLRYAHCPHDNCNINNRNVQAKVNVAAFIIFIIAACSSIKSLKSFIYETQRWFQCSSVLLWTTAKHHVVFITFAVSLPVALSAFIQYNKAPEILCKSTSECLSLPFPPSLLSLIISTLWCKQSNLGTFKNTGRLRRLISFHTFYPFFKELPISHTLTQVPAHTQGLLSAAKRESVWLNLADLICSLQNCRTDKTSRRRWRRRTVRRGSSGRREQVSEMVSAVLAND